jgi:hypothetical protein
VRTRELNRALLARQLLLERASLSLPEALERIAGIQAQYAPSMYIGLWTRLAGFERGALTAAIEDRTVVVGTLMRTTIHLVSPADYWPFAIATRAVRRAQWLRSLDDRQGPGPRDPQLGRSRPRAPVRHVGAPPRRPVRGRARLARHTRAMR